MAAHAQIGGIVALASLFLIGATSPETFEDSILEEHNLARAEVGQSPLRWNRELARGAKQWADYLAKTGRFEHSPNIPGQSELGENIWGGTPERFHPRRMVAAWVAEKRHFKPGIFPANSTTSEVGDVSHYTQVIWRDTREVGCSTSQGEYEEILVCRYSSPGNIIGTRPI